MRKKFSVWNRLALVAAILFSVVFLAYQAYLIDELIGRVNKDDYDMCAARVEHPEGLNSAYQQKVYDCWQDRKKSNYAFEIKLLKEEIPNRMIGALIICVGTYGLIWLITSVTGWILRGRKEKAA